MGARRHQMVCNRSKATWHGCGGLETEHTVCVPSGRYLHVVARCAEKKLGVIMVTVSHVTAAVRCGLEMELWSTFWMVDHVSLMAGGGLSASRMG